FNPPTFLLPLFKLTVTYLNPPSSDGVLTSLGSFQNLFCLIVFFTCSTSSSSSCILKTGASSSIFKSLSSSEYKTSLPSSYIAIFLLYIFLYSSNPAEYLVTIIKGSYVAKL